MLRIPDAYRKDASARKDYICASDVTFLCLPDQASREAVALADGKVKIIDRPRLQGKLALRNLTAHGSYAASAFRDLRRLSDQERRAVPSGIQDERAARRILHRARKIAQRIEFGRIPFRAGMRSISTRVCAASLACIFSPVVP